MRGIAATASLFLSVTVLGVVEAQPLAAMWGARFVPERHEVTEWSVEFALHSQFDKDTSASGAFTFRPYSDRNETLGLNLLSYRTVRAWQPRRGLGQNTRAPLGDSHSVLISESLTLGFTGDGVTSWLQNDVIHFASWRRSKLLPIPRDSSDTPQRTKRVPLSFSPEIAQYGASAIFRLATTHRHPDRDWRVVSPFFAGAGFSVGTLFQESFVQVGVLDFERDVDINLGGFLRLASVGGAAAARLGVLTPGRVFRDITANYSAAQALVRLRGAVAGFGVSYELVNSSLDGFHVAPRSSEQLQLVAERGRPAAEVYESKTPRRERFSAHRMQLGSFTFIVSNDSPGGKDSGPTFSAHISSQLSSRRWESRTVLRQLGRILEPSRK
jgi:hypothetical protein